MDTVQYEGVEQALETNDTQILIFGKPDARPGRRMGVALAKADTIETARAQADRAAACIKVQEGSTHP